MITEFMKLTTARDAAQWASDFGLDNDADVKTLSDWIWNNKPRIGCTYSEHPVSSLSTNDFWDLFA